MPETKEKSVPRVERLPEPRLTRRSRRSRVSLRLRSTTESTGVVSNFCRVTGTPEELIVDFGLNPQPFGVPTAPIAITQRIITNFYTAKRMLAALQMTIQRHEATFGVPDRMSRGESKCSGSDRLRPVQFHILARQ